MHYNVSNACKRGVDMKQITVRGVGNDLHQAIRNEAGKRGVSMNQAVLALLSEGLGLANGSRPQPIEYHDLDHMMGTWSQEEADEFEEHLKHQRTIDEALWL